MRVVPVPLELPWLSEWAFGGCFLDKRFEMHIFMDFVKVDFEIDFAFDLLDFLFGLFQNLAGPAEGGASCSVDGALVCEPISPPPPRTTRAGC